MQRNREISGREQGDSCPDQAANTAQLEAVVEGQNGDPIGRCCHCFGKTATPSPRIWSPGWPTNYTLVYQQRPPPFPYNRDKELTAPLAQLSIFEAYESFLLSSPKISGFYGAHQRVPKGKVWGKVRRRQLKSTFSLLEKCFPNRSFASFTHDDLLTFFRILTQLPRDHHKSPADKDRSIQEICGRAPDAPGTGNSASELGGLSTYTINHHIVLVRMVHLWLSRATSVEKIYWSDVLFPDGGVARSKRAGYSSEQMREMFSLPIWVGRRKSYGRLERGAQIFHDAAYWVPLLCWYTAARREELCGLLVDDIQKANDILYLRVVSNQYRSLKTRSSERDIPLHSELLRLGFITYAAEMRDRGETLLFPELYVSDSTSLGHILFQRAWRQIRRELPWLQYGQSFHSIRHGANHALKEQEVFSEKRSDLLGHVGKNQSENRYASQSSLGELNKVVQRIPVVTDHLSSSPLIVLRGWRDRMAAEE